MRRCVLGEAILDWENVRSAALDHFPTYSAFIDKWESEIVAQAGEADRPKRGETRGSVHEHAVAESDAPKGSSK